MSYLLDKKNKRKKFVIIISGIILLIILFFFRTGIWNGLSFITLEIFHPVLVGGNSAKEKLKTFGIYFYSKKSLNDENETLRAKLIEGEAEMLNYDAINAENILLKEILGRKKENVSMVLAAILSKPNQSAYDTLVVDAGTLEGIKIGNTVFAEGNIPIGRIGETTPNTSKVILFSSPRERTLAVISRNALSDISKKDIFYELVGRGGGNFEMILPRDITLQKDDIAVMRGLHPYALAKVETTISESRDPFTKVLFVSPVNIQELRFVEIEIE